MNQIEITFVAMHRQETLVKKKILKNPKKIEGMVMATSVKEIPDVVIEEKVIPKVYIEAQEIPKVKRRFLELQMLILNRDSKAMSKILLKK